MTLAFRSSFARTLTFAGATLAAAPAFAHHAMDGKTPTTFMQGLLSGFAHPVIGFDHLAFLVALAWLVARLPLALRSGLIAAFVVGSLAGTGLHLRAFDLPASELLVALSVLVIGVAVALRRAPPAGLLWVALPVAGVLHGYAYGESIVGAEAAPLGAYLLGFALIQFVLASGVSAFLSGLRAPALQRGALVAGALVAATGAVFAAQHVLG
jgi:urease accessory protein